MAVPTNGKAILLATFVAFGAFPRPVPLQHPFFVLRMVRVLTQLSSLVTAGGK